MPKPSKLDPYVHLLGQRTDADVAALAGVTREAVRIYRTRRGIAALRDAGRPGEDLPPEPGETPARVKRRRGSVVEAVASPAVEPPPATEVEPSRPGRKNAEQLLAPFREQLGTVDDGKIAELAGLSRGVVGAYRRKHGIQAYDGYLWTTQRRPRSEAQASDPGPAEKAAKPARKLRKSKPAAPAPAAPPRRGPPSKLDAVRDLVGVLTDAEVATRVGLSRSAVQMYRRKHDIPAPSKREGGAAVAAVVDAAPSAPAPAPAPVVPERVPSVAAAPLIAWRLTLRVGGAEVERYAITADSSSVGRLGDAAGEVLRIERVGEALG